MKRVTSEKEQIEATYCNGKQKKHHKELSSPTLESFGERRSKFEKQTRELMEKARLRLVDEEVDRRVAEKLKQLEPFKSLTKERSMESTEIITPMDDQTINLGEYLLLKGLCGNCLKFFYDFTTVMLDMYV